MILSDSSFDESAYEINVYSVETIGVCLCSAINRVHVLISIASLCP